MDDIQTIVDTLRLELHDPWRWVLMSLPIAIVAIVIVAVRYYRLKHPVQLIEEKEQRVEAPPQESWLHRLHVGLAKTRSQFTSGMSQLFASKRILDATLQEQVHELLFKADIGVATAKKLVANLGARFGQNETEWESVRTSLRGDLLEILGTQSTPVLQGESQVLLIVGVNGVGKTTTVAKLAAHFQSLDRSVLLCAADTFRAAAIDQLKVWGERLEIGVIAQQQGSDPASVAFDAVKAAKSRKSDLLIIDTAGRLHNKKELMDELSKINRIIAREQPGAPHETWLVIDATTGQNALSQIKAFSEAVKLTGLVVTKLDGTAKGGVLIAAAAQYQLPIRYIGVGESADDLRPFVAQEFVDSILGLSVDSVHG